MWLVGPIVLAIFILIRAVFALNFFEVEQVVTGYEYKEKIFDEEAIGTINILVSEENWRKKRQEPILAKCRK